MAVLTQIPTTNISVVDIRDTLNAHGGNVSNDTTTFFTTAAKINPWSKHKPVALASDFCQDFDSSRADYDADWWKGNDGKCGLSWSTFAWKGPGNTSSDTIPQIKSSNWTYTPPSSSYPKRLGDFSRYVISVNPPIATRITASKIDVDQNDGTWTFEPDILPKNDNELTAHDFDKSLTGWYLCVAIYQSGWNIYIGDSVLTSGCKVEVDLDDLNVGGHEVVLCLATGKTGTFMPLPSDNDNKTNFILNVKYINDLAIEFIGLSNSKNGTYNPLENYVDMESGFPATDRIWFKVSIKKMKASANSVTASNIIGSSETWTDGYVERTLENRLMNSSMQYVSQIDISTLSVGQSITAYIDWDYGNKGNSEEPYLMAELMLNDNNGSYLGAGYFFMKK